MAKKSTAIVRQPTVEVIAPPGRIASDQQRLDELVQQKVAEILAAREDFVFEPFFRSRQVAAELRRLQTVPEHRKWAVFYERHGCLRCLTSKRVHAGNGFCPHCRSWVVQTLQEIIRELTEKGEGQ